MSPLLAGRRALAVSAIELLADGPQLTLLELADRQPTPAISRVGDRVLPYCR